MKLSASVHNSKLLDWKAFEQPLTGALSSTMQTTVKELQKEIKKAVQDNFYYPEDPDKLTTRWFDRQGHGILSAELTYKFKSVSLSRYPVLQHRITTSRRVLRVARGGKYAGNKFTRKIVEEEIIETLVQIRKKGSMKLVHGKLGYMGWLHTGRRSGQVGYNGQTNKFSSKIFERNQQATWADGQRLPIHQLFGPSLVQLLKTPEVQNVIANSASLRKIDQLLLKAILL